MKKINKIKIKLNGKKVKISEKTSLQKLIYQFNLPIKKVAIELNKKIVDKRTLTKIKLKENDKIEIVHFIGGG